MGQARRKKIIEAQNSGLSETQKNISNIRKRMNRRELEQEKVHYFTKGKIWTYVWIFLCPPYGLYRVWKKNSEFNYSEKMVQTITCITYCVILIQTLFFKS